MSLGSFHLHDNLFWAPRIMKCLLLSPPPGSSIGKESACNAGDLGFDPWVGKIPWRKEWLPTPVFWPGESHGLVHGVSKSWTQLSGFHFYFTSPMPTMSLLRVGLVSHPRSRLHKHFFEGVDADGRSGRGLEPDSAEVVYLHPPLDHLF